MTADAITARLAAGHNGGLTHEVLTAAGVSPDQIRKRRADGVIIDLRRGVYRHAAVAPSWAGTLHTAVLAAGPGAVASHRSAAVLHDLDGFRAGRAEITVRAADLPLRTGARVHRTTLLDPIDVTAVRQTPTTALPRTMLDLGAVVAYERVEQAVQDAIIRKLVEPGELLAVLERVAKRGRRGAGVLRAVVRAGLPDERLASMLELKLFALLRQAGLDAPELQYEIVCRSGRRYVLDAAWPRHRVAIEGNGHRWHGTSAQLHKDMERRRDLQSEGWAVYDYGWSDVTESAFRTLTELRRLAGLLAR